ncbi:CBS domain-containing protein [Yinghuangia sp. YIM S10712]|uniref:CBS domain-containing protein n=1 Tax=Yinghuangia sp. YIM S10712 TaxID=3436930 RepID=UPI003F52C87F
MTTQSVSGSPGPQPAQSPADQLKALVGQHVTLVQILEICGHRRRTDQSVSDIDRILTDAGLGTFPDFRFCGRSASVQILKADDLGSLTGPATESLNGGGTAGSEADELALPRHTLKLRDIPSATAGIESLPPSATLAQAKYLMQAREFSQVPVIDSAGRVHGMITWRSIAEMYAANKEPTLLNALDSEGPHCAPGHSDLFAQIPVICRYGHALVTEHATVVAGIVTTADLSHYFGSTAQPFFLVGRVESLIRQWLGVLPADNIAIAQSFGADKPETRGKIGELTIGDYIKLLDEQHPQAKHRTNAAANWSLLDRPDIDRQLLVHQLRRANRIRNQIAHFHPASDDNTATRELGQCIQILKSLV